MGCLEKPVVESESILIGAPTWNNDDTGKERVETSRADARISRCSLKITMARSALRINCAGTNTFIHAVRSASQSRGGKPTLGIEGGHTTGASGGHGLAIVIVGDVAGGEHPFYAGVRAEGDRPLDVALRR